MDIKAKVLECQERLYKENEIALEPSLDHEFDRDHGIDSLGVVNFVVDLEDELGIDLDNVLGQIRNCKTFNEVADVVSTL